MTITKTNLRRHSAVQVDGADRAPARAMLRGAGVHVAGALADIPALVRG